MLNVEMNPSDFGNPTFTSTYHTMKGGELFSCLARLSKHQQWILFTGECPRPQYNELSAHHIHCSKIIHMKPSQSQSEITIVMKAIQSGNASAIVASGNIDLVSQKLLQQMANEHQCEVFFLPPTQHQYH